MHPDFQIGRLSIQHLSIAERAGWAICPTSLPLIQSRDARFRNAAGPWSEEIQARDYGLDTLATHESLNASSTSSTAR